MLAPQITRKRINVDREKKAPTEEYVHISAGVDTVVRMMRDKHKILLCSCGLLQGRG